MVPGGRGGTARCPRLRHLDCGCRRDAVRGELTEVGDANAPEPQAVVEVISGMAALRRAPRLADVAEVAAFLASDRAAGMTGTMVNATCGLVLR